MSAADFSRAIVPHFRPSERLRDRVIDLARHRAIGGRNTARIKVALSAFATTLCVAILASLARGVQRLLSKPLDALGRRIVALSDGDTSHVAMPRGIGRDHADPPRAGNLAPRDRPPRHARAPAQRHADAVLARHARPADLADHPDRHAGATIGRRADEAAVREDRQAGAAHAGAGRRLRAALACGGQRLRACAGQPRRPDERGTRRRMAARAPEIHVDRRRAAARRHDRARRPGAAVARADQPAGQRHQVQRVADGRRMQGRAGRRRQDRALHDPRQRCGISSADQTRLFERYRRFRTAGQPETSGVEPAWRSSRPSSSGTKARSTCTASCCRAPRSRSRCRPRHFHDDGTGAAGASGRHGTAAPPDSSIYSIEPFSGQPRATTPFAGSPQPAWNCSP